MMYIGKSWKNVKLLKKKDFLSMQMTKTLQNLLTLEKTQISKNMPIAWNLTKF